ncbi:MAG: hypothetical protein F6K47_33520 [Symploca sp. SIO2E6]|nr:hypothetical protein [Symploca sp. SIO2E6]
MNVSEVSLLRVRTSYNQIKALAEGEVQALLAEKDNRISSLENMVETALQRPGVYAQTYNHQGDTMPDKTSKISISGVEQWRRMLWMLYPQFSSGELG